MSHLKQPVNFTVGIVLKKVRDKNCIEIRAETVNPECIKEIVEAGLLDKPLLVLPKYRDKLAAIARLSQEGIIEYNYNKGIYKFLI